MKFTLVSPLKHVNVMRHRIDSFQIRKGEKNSIDLRRKICIEKFEQIEAKHDCKINSNIFIMARKIIN